MIYHGTQMTETIWIGPMDDQTDVHCIELIKDCDEPMFYVTNCCNTDWVWRFYMDGESNYEMIKHTIIDTAFECANVIELLDALDEIFATDFEDIVAWEECECDGGCGRCCCQN